MSDFVPAVQPPHHTYMDDEIAALALQLEEINCYSENQKGKYPINNLPDWQLAFVNFETEILAHLGFLRDLKLAHSIARAVNNDAQAIADIAREETQAQEDRRLAVQLSGNSPELEEPPQYSMEDPNKFIGKETLDRLANLLYHDDAGSEKEEDEAGPSIPYTQRQAEALRNLSQEAFECCACTNRFGWNSIIHLDCKHFYCIDCLKGLFMRSIKDFTLFPPRCCGNHIPLGLIAMEFAEDYLDAFRNAEIEFSIKDKIYCSNAECGSFIPPTQIQADRAECTRCNTATCTMCNNASHLNDCAADFALQATLNLATSEGWQRCFACRAVVEINLGCNHIRCRCGAQFCYVCGLEWQNCSCAFWNERNLLQRAEQIVDREALHPLPHHERQRRVTQMREELQENHECEHPGRFQRLFNAGRRGFQCELCDVRHWKYILQCRRCHMVVCEECRRNRV